MVSCAGTATFATAGVGAGKTVTVTRPDADGRGGGQLHAGDDRRRRRRRRSPARDRDADGDGGEQGVRRDDEGDAHELHADGRGRRRRGRAARARRRSPRRGVGAGKTVTVSGLTLTGAAAGNYTLATHDGDDDGGDYRGPSRRPSRSPTSHTTATTSATIVSCPVSPTMGADQVACTGTASFTTASVGAGKTVTVTRARADRAAAAANYALASTTTTTTATIQANQVAGRDESGSADHDFGAGVSLVLAASDLDGDPLTWSATNLPPGSHDQYVRGVSGTPTTARHIQRHGQRVGHVGYRAGLLRVERCVAGAPGCEHGREPVGPGCDGDTGRTHGRRCRASALPALDHGCQPGITHRRVVHAGRRPDALRAGTRYGGGAAGGRRPDSSPGARSPGILAGYGPWSTTVNVSVRSWTRPGSDHGSGGPSGPIAHANADLLLEPGHRRDLVPGFQ